MNSTSYSLRRALATFSIAVTGILLFSSCTKNLGSGEQTPAAGLMAFNLATDKPAVGISLSGNELVNVPLNYTNYTGGYLSVYTGNRAIVSYNNSRDSILATSETMFEPNKYYSLFVTGNGGTYKNIVAWDNLDSLSSTSGKAYVRYINAVPDSNAITVSMTSNGSSVINDPSNYSKVSEFIPVNPGEVQVRLTGGDLPVSANRNITLETGKAYTVLLVGLPAATDTAKAVQIKFIRNAG